MKYRHSECPGGKAAVLMAGLRSLFLIIRLSGNVVDQEGRFVRAEPFQNGDRGVEHRDPLRGAAFEYAAVGVAVKSHLHLVLVERDFEAAGAHKGIDLQGLALDGLANGRVVQEHDRTLGAELGQGLLELERLVDRFLDELLDERLAPGVEHGRSESASKTADPRKTNPIDLMTFTV